MTEENTENHTTDVNLEQIAASKTLNKFTDEELSNIIASLEEVYPQYNRLMDGWKLIGFAKNKNTGNVNVPIHKYMWWDKSRYSGEKLRELRKERGCGSKKVRERYLARTKALDELTAVSQELNMGY